MSKSSLPADLDELPPPYTSTSSDPPTFDPTIFSSSLSSHLSSLPSHVRSTASANTTRRTAADLSTISLLLPHIEAFLSAAAQRAGAPPPSSSRAADLFDEHGARKPLIGELTLVPAAAVSRKAERGDVHERRREGEFLRIARVAPLPSKGATGDRKQMQEARGVSGTAVTGYRPANAPEASGTLRAWDPERDERFDSWGRFGDDAAPAAESSGETYDDGGSSGNYNDSKEEDDPAMRFWVSEATARRLARYLQPSSAAAQEPKPAPSLARKVVQKAVRDEQEKKSWFGRSKPRKAADEQPKTRAEDVVVVEEAASARPQDDNVVMNVKAEELSFQMENEFGLYESVTGWGIVVGIKIRRT